MDDETGARRRGGSGASGAWAAGMVAVGIVVMALGLMARDEAAMAVASVRARATAGDDSDVVVVALRTAPRQDAAPVPAPSFDMREPSVLTLAQGFDAALAAFAERQRHDRALNAGKWIRFTCPAADACGGWGDRVKGVMSAFALALLTNRSLSIELTRNYDLAEVYNASSSLVDWRPLPLSPPRPSPAASLSCFGKRCHDCFIPGAVDGFRGNGALAQADEVVVTLNYDCAGLLARNPHFSDASKRLGISHDAAWLSKAFEALFQPSHALWDAMRKPYASSTTARFPPPAAMHVRFFGGYTLDGTHVANGASPGDHATEKASVTEVGDLAKTYAACVRRVVDVERLGDPASQLSPVFVAGDNDEALARFRSRLGLEAMGLTVLSGAGTGPLTHVDKLRGGELRVHAEFELLRRARFLVAGDSGFSLFAHKVRFDADQLVWGVSYAANEPCSFPWTTRVIPGHRRRRR